MFLDYFMVDFSGPCELSPMSGNCDDALNKYFYDPASDECLMFVYTGCKGNKNRFDSREACMRKCGGFSKYSAIFRNGNSQEFLGKPLKRFSPEISIKFDTVQEAGYWLEFLFIVW